MAGLEDSSMVGLAKMKHECQGDLKIMENLYEAVVEPDGCMRLNKA